MINWDNFHDEINLISAHAVLCCIIDTVIPDIARMDMHKMVVFRNAFRGPFSSICFPYTKNNAMEAGLANVIANG